MKLRSILFFLFFVAYACFGQEAENKRFNLNLIAGLQGAQIDGDYYGGYNKAGVYVGLAVSRQLNDKMDFSLGMAFSQKGARENPDPENGYYDFYLAKMNYLEIPIQITHKFKKFDFFWGAYYGRLISSKEENQNGMINTGLQFKSNDVGYGLGLEYKIFDGVLLGVRHAYSILPVRDYFFNGKVGYTFFMQRLFNRGLYNNTLMFYMRYQFNLPEKSKN